MKKYVIIIDGYVRNEVYEKIVSALDTRVGYCLDGEYNGVHIYPYNTEGYQLFVASNHSIPSDDLNDVVCSSGDVDSDMQKTGKYPLAGNCLYEEESLLPREDWDELSDDYYYIGAIKGYNPEGTELYQC